MSGAELIAAERQRQIDVEGYTAEHDDTYVLGELEWAGRAYASGARFRPDLARSFAEGGQLGWPFPIEFFKPTTRIENLTKAGAFIAAEIDRLERLEGRETS